MLIYDVQVQLPKLNSEEAVRELSPEASWLYYIGYYGGAQYTKEPAPTVVPAAQAQFINQARDHAFRVEQIIRYVTADFRVNYEKAAVGE